MSEISDPPIDGCGEAAPVTKSTADAGASKESGAATELSKDLPINPAAAKPESTGHEHNGTHAAEAATATASSQPEIATASEAADATSWEASSKGNDGADEEDEINPVDFQGTVDSNNELPSAATLKKIGDYIVLDRHGKTHTFKSLYSGSHVARRVLVIFVRHFFCGNCQEYLRTLSASITPEALLRLPISTFIAVVGCGDPKLIDMYAEATGCPFPIYADPTRKLYDELGMVRTLALGERPAYMKKSLLRSSLDSVVQGLKQVRAGLALKAGDQRQIGGEFLFEPVSLHTPIPSPAAVATGDDATKSLGSGHAVAHAEGASLDPGGEHEEKRVSWCHRMKNTRDHAEMPELMEVLGLDGHGQPIDDQRRWSKALEQRKGTGLSLAHEINVMKIEDKKAAAAAEKAAAKASSDGAASL